MNRGDGSALDFSRRASRLEVSPTVATAQRASALKASGVYVFDFSVGEPDQPTPAHITNAAVAALEAGQTKYTPAAGLPDLRAAVAARYRKDFKVTFAPEEVAITVGGKQALYLACQALLDRGDEVVIPSPVLADLRRGRAPGWRAAHPRSGSGEGRLQGHGADDQQGDDGRGPRP